MNTQLFNAFLLATAQEPWHIWWYNTRLIFADFLDESGEDAKALALRTMECVVMDEWDMEGMPLRSIQIEAFSQPRPRGEIIPILIVRVLPDGISQSLFTYPLDLRFALQQEFSTQIIGNGALRLICVIDPPANARLQYTFSSDRGIWQGQLSLDRAQRRCRRCVLEMFSRHALESAAGTISDCVSAQVWDQLFAYDDSPRWVPFEAQTRGSRYLTHRHRDLIPLDDWPEIRGEPPVVDLMRRIVRDGGGEPLILEPKYILLPPGFMGDALDQE